MMDKPLCPETGDMMERDVRPMTIEYQGMKATFNMPGWYCPTCGEGIHDGKEMKLADRALNLLKAKEKGYLTPDKIKKLRRKLKLSQADAGELIGGGPRAFQKYESGDILPSRGILSALVLLANDPSRVQELREALPDKVKV